MRAAVVFVSILFAPLGASAQTQTPAAHEGPPDIQIVKFSWMKERFDWEKNPFSATAEGFVTRDRIRSERTRGSALQTRAALEEKAAKERPPDPPRYVFHYKVTVRNGAPKAIKEIDWDYLFTDTTTGEELGRREFTSVEKVGAGKSKELSILVSSPPTQRISVYTLGKKERDGLVGQVVIVRILFDDGSTWQAR
jgi:hypothetical protein